MPVDFQIIGGGLIGLSTAYALLLRGAGQVRILEAREGVALETSYANAGMVHASLAAPWNAPGIGAMLLKHMLGSSASMKLKLSALPELAGWGRKFLRGSEQGRHWHAAQSNYRLAEYSLKINRQWRETLAIEDEYTGDGLLKLFRTQKEYARAKELNQRLEDLGLETHSLDAQGAVHKEAALAPAEASIAGALYYPHDFKADAYRFCQALEQAIRALGGQIVTGACVNGFIKAGTKVTGVKTDTRDYLSKMTIVASGAHSYQLMSMLGHTLPVRPVKGYSLTFPLHEMRDKMPKIPVVDDSLHVAITPLGARIRVAGMAEIAGFDSGRPPRSLRILHTMLQRVYPELAKECRLDTGEVWHGFRPVSADGVPFIGVFSQGGLAINTGHGHMGWTLCAGSGDALADTLLGQPSGYDLSSFCLNRTY